MERRYANWGVNTIILIQTQVPEQGSDSKRLLWEGYAQWLVKAAGFCWLRLSWEFGLFLKKYTSSFLSSPSHQAGRKASLLPEKPADTQTQLQLKGTPRKNCKDVLPLQTPVIYLFLLLLHLAQNIYFFPFHFSPKRNRCHNANRNPCVV